MSDASLKEMNAKLRSVMQTLPNAVYADLGCSNLSTINQAIGWLPSFKTFLAVEPDPRNIAWIKRNGVPRGVELIECAISDHDGEMDLILSGSDTNVAFNHMWSVSSSLRQPKEHDKHWPFVHFRDRVKVPVRTLASICAERGIKGFDFLWLDIQGSEVDAYRGSPEVYENTKWVFCEAETFEAYAGQWTRNAMLAEMSGFELAGAWDHDCLLRNKSL